MNAGCRRRSIHHGSLESNAASSTSSKPACSQALRALSFSTNASAVTCIRRPVCAQHTSQRRTPSPPRQVLPPLWTRTMRSWPSASTIRAHW